MKIHQSQRLLYLDNDLSLITFATSINMRLVFIFFSVQELRIFKILCWCLEGGISNHIATNELLRSEKWFGLGAIVPAQDWFDFKAG